jgi:protein gp37
MGQKSTIEWTDASWTPIRARVKQDAAAIATAKGYVSLIPVAQDMAGHVGPHCERVSPGCENCYSERNNVRCLPQNGTRLPFDRRARELADIFVDEKILAQPLHWKTPRKIFVCSQTDLFGDWVSDEMIDRVFAVMALCQQHTFQVLTKRPERMLKWFADLPSWPKEIYWDDKAEDFVTPHCRRIEDLAGALLGVSGPAVPPFWPLPNVWLGVSVESNEYLHRAEKLIEVPAAARFVSYEPALGPLNARGILMKGEDPGQCANCGHGHGFNRCPNYGCISRERTRSGRRGGEVVCADFKRKNFAIHWIIAGGESGPGARPANPKWLRDVRDHCIAAGISFFFKQWGEYAPESQLSQEVFVRAVSGGTGSKHLADTTMHRVGKKAAGALLDGKEWKQFPEARTV